MLTLILNPSKNSAKLLMEVVKCDVCLKNKTALKCSMCSKSNCKHCVHFIDESVFEFLDLLPENLQDKGFCPNCYDDHISEQLSEYLNCMELAKNVNIYTKEQSSETRLMRRDKKPLKIKDCNDREETLLRLAYLAALDGYETLIDVNLVSKKISTGGRYKKLIWDGTAIPLETKQSTRLTQRSQEQ